MDIPQDWQNIYDANSDSSSSGNSIGSSKSLSNSHSSMSTTNSTSTDSRSVKSSNDSEMLQDCGTAESSAEVPAASSPRDLEEEDFTSGSLLMSSGDQEPSLTLHCTGCKSSSPAVANCFSCPSLLCANCVVAHQLMVAFEGHNVTNLGQGDNKENNPDNAEAIKKIAKEGRRKLNELQKTVKSVDYSSSRYIGDSIRRKCFNEYFVTD